MSTTTNLLNLLTTPGDFVLKGDGVAKKAYKGQVVDLTKISRAAAEALANDPKCGFVQWAPGKGPKPAPAPAAEAPGKA